MIPQLTPQALRQMILTQSMRAKVGHIGSALSIVEIITALYGEILHLPSPDDPDRDRFILSKGHAALALYAALHLRGWLSAADLDSFCSEASLLGVHPEHQVPGIDFSSGSLGQGLSVGVGAALAARWQKSARRVFVLMSDAEMNEGSVWEAAQVAGHHQLSHLVGLVDFNRQQAFGYTREVLNQDNLADRWAAFGWQVQIRDGHDLPGLIACLQGLNTHIGPPHLIIAHTTFGKGVSFMENRIPWHYFPMTPEHYEQAMGEVLA